jgi:GT2 family glycosyltransferase
MPSARVELKKQVTAVKEAGRKNEDILRQIIEEQGKKLADLERACDDLYRRNEDLHDAMYALLHKVHTIEQQSPDGAAAYHDLLTRIRSIVRNVLSRDATVIVASKGDDDLLRLYGKKAFHFPQTEDGTYAGHHPANGVAAIAHLEALRSKGADHFLLPNTMFWWLDHYVDFKRYLETHYRLIVRQEDACAIFSLCAESASDDSWQSRFSSAIGLYESQTDEKPSVLDWNTGLNLAGTFPDVTVFLPPTTDKTLPYFNHSVDFVAVRSWDFVSRAEAQRVARIAVMKFKEPENGRHEPILEIDWLTSVTQSPETLTPSIVIPCCTSLREAKACLDALLETLPQTFAGEIILVDALPDEKASADLEGLTKTDRRLKTVRCGKLTNVLAACNRGAKAASGDILIFVNTAIVPLRGWLTALVQTFRDNPQAGAAGGRLLLADGRLEGAGGITYSNGSLGGFGNLDPKVDVPLYNFVRNVDFCHLTLLATRRSLFDQLSGFDDAFISDDYSAADYGFRLRMHGYESFYQPESLAVRGGQSATRLNHEAGRELFLRRWKKELKHRAASSNGVGR